MYSLCFMNVFIGPGKAEGRSSLEGALLVQVVQLMNIRLLCLMISDYFTGFTCFLQGVHVSDTWYVSWFLNCYFISCPRRAICFLRSCLMFVFFFYYIIYIQGLRMGAGIGRDQCSWWGTAALRLIRFNTITTHHISLRV